MYPLNWHLQTKKMSLLYCGDFSPSQKNNEEHGYCHVRSYSRGLMPVTRALEKNLKDEHEEMV